MALEQEVYCAICGAGFTQIVDLEFHQSAHDVKFTPSELENATGPANDHEGEIAVTRIMATPHHHALLATGHHNPAFPGPAEQKPSYPTSENKLRPVHQHAYHQHLSDQLNYQRSHYANPDIGQPTHHAHPISNNPMQASGAPVYGTAPQRDLPSAAGSTAFWQLPPVLHDNTTGGQEQQVYARPEDVYHLYGSLQGQQEASGAPGDLGDGGSPDEVSSNQAVSEMDDERSTEME